MFRQICNKIGFKNELFHGSTKQDQRNGFGLQLFYGPCFYIGNWKDNELQGEGLLLLNEYIFMIGKFVQGFFSHGRICWKNGLYFQGKLCEEKFFLKGEFYFRQNFSVQVEYDLEQKKYKEEKIIYKDKKFRVANSFDNIQFKESDFKYQFENNRFIFIEYFSQSKNIKNKFIIASPSEFQYIEYESAFNNKKQFQISSFLNFTVKYNQYDQVQKVNLLNGVNFTRQKPKKNNPQITQNNDLFDIKLHNLEKIKIFTKFEIHQNYLGQHVIENFVINDLLLQDDQDEYNICEKFTCIEDLDCVAQNFTFKQLYKKLLTNDVTMFLVATFLSSLDKSYLNFLLPYLTKQQKNFLNIKDNQQQFGNFKLHVSYKKLQSIQLQKLNELYKIQNNQTIQINYLNQQNHTMSISLFFN